MVEGLAAWLLDPSELTPHGFCLLWTPWLIWSHATADVAIGVAYCSIPIALVQLVRQRQDLAFKPVFWLFAAFILLCGTGHFIDLATIWAPVYGLGAIVKVMTAVVSVATAIALWPLMPQVLALPSPSQLRSANDALARSEARYRAGFLRSPAALLTLDRDGRITGASDRWLALMDYPPGEVIGSHIARFVEGGRRSHDADWAHLFAAGEVFDIERRFVRRDGEALDILMSARVERGENQMADWVMVAFVDVTARRRAEAALRASEERQRQTQKMEALGQLAGGIAHDFNNVLQAISSSITLIEQRPDDPARVRRFGRLISDAAARGSATTRRLLAFARRSELRSIAVGPAALLTEIGEIFRHSLGSSIQVQVDAGPDLPFLFADRGELETVLVNLGTNARDAMPDGGTLTLSAAAEEIGACEDHASGLAPGAYIRISVRDTGAGMDASTLASACEPFFTTKPLGKGTGLGLSTARGFAQQSGGGLSIDSAPGVGTTVTLWLPLAQGVPDPRSPQAAHDPPAAMVSRGTILLVDDDPLVREPLTGELEALGFRIIPADGGPGALEILARGQEIDLLVTDLSMPGMDGLKVVEAVRQRRPDLPAILVTGYAGDAPLPADTAGARFVLMRKPVTAAAIAEHAALLMAAPEVC